MRLYSMHKREFVMVIVAFFACFGLAVFIGLAGKLHFYSLIDDYLELNNIIYAMNEAI